MICSPKTNHTKNISKRLCLTESKTITKRHKQYKRLSKYEQYVFPFDLSIQHLKTSHLKLWIVLNLKNCEYVRQKESKSSIKSTSPNHKTQFM